MSDERSSHDVTTDVHDENARLEHTARFEERLRTQKDAYEEKLRLLQDECEEKLRVQREESEERLRVLEETVVTLRAGMDVYGPFPYDDLPLELMALVSDFVDDVDDLASLSLVSHRVRNGVLLSRPWIVVGEIVAAMSSAPVPEQRRILRSRRKCATYACRKGLVRTLRALNLSRSEVVKNIFHIVRWTCQLGQLEVLKYLHVTYALTAEELDRCGPYVDGQMARTPMGLALDQGEFELVTYLRTVGGVTVPRSALNTACFYGRLETLKYLHTEVGFTAEDVRLLDMSPLQYAAWNRDRDIVVYLRTEFGLTKEDARQCPGNWRWTRELFKSLVCE